MRDIPVKVTGSLFTADELNDMVGELENIITSAGQTLTSADLEQLGKAVAVYAAGGWYYTDSGTADSYVLSAVGTKKTPPAYFDGMRVAFVAGNSNTTSSVINVAALGAKNLNRANGANAAAEDLMGGTLVEAVYNSSGGYFELIERRADKQLYGGTDTGAADAYVLTVPEAPSTYFVGMRVAFTPANQNTGASTININSVGAANIKRLGAAPLTARDIKTTAVAELMYDGAQFILSNPQRVDLPAYQKLFISNGGGDPLSRVDVDADFINIEGVLSGAVNLTADITTSGANGLDTGSEANSTWYHIYVIWDPVNAVSASLLSIRHPESATDVTFPSGYTSKKYVGSVYNNSSGDFDVFSQNGRNVTVAPTVVLSGGTATTRTSIAINATIPPTATTVMGIATATASGTGTVFVFPAITGPQVDVLKATIGSSGAGGAFQAPWFENNNIYYQVGVNITGADITLNGYEVDNV